MGKRRERRLAAKIGAGRRVKLDLFDEPSDVGGSSAKDEVGKHLDVKLDPVLPGSPSSGQKAENPLSLLGQYSDDEVDEGSNEKVVGLDIDNKAEVSADEHLEEGEVCGNEDLSSRKVDNQGQERDSSTAIALQVATDDDVTTNLVSLDEKLDEVSGEKQNSVSLASGSQTSGEMNSSWRMVFDENSNSYYYWNTATGETSWEVPENFVQAAVTNEFEISGKQTGERCRGDFSNSASDEVGYSSRISDMKLAYEQVAPESKSVDQCEVDGDQLLGMSSVNALPYETSGHYLMPEQFSGGIGSLTMDSYDVHGHSAMSSEHVDFASHLVKYCEELLERLNLLQRSGIDTDVSAWFSKYISEIEVRLSDIRALLSYGPSLSPFWLHSQRQINQLENAVNAALGKQDVEPCTVNLNFTEVKDIKLEGRGENLKVDENLTKLSPGTTAGVMLDVDASVEVQKSLHENASDCGSLKVPQIAVSDPSTESHLRKAGSVEIDVHEKEKLMLEVQSSEDVGMDVDMDVDMEVEVPSPTGTTTIDTGGILLVQSDPSVHSSFLSGQCPSTENEAIPPPPEEDWIPPPPPDDEGIPPPPPEEPPESLFAPPPPSEPQPDLERETVPDSLQSMYGGQYGLSYGQSNVNYYGNPSLVSLGNSFYENSCGSQISAVNLPAYYAGVSNSQPSTVLTSGSTGVYYGVQNGVSPVVTLAGSMGSSGTQVTASNLICDAPLTSEIASISSSLEESSTRELIVDLAKTQSSQVSSASAISAPATVSLKEHSTVSSFSVAAASSASVNLLIGVSDASAVASKVQSKASRMKKPKVSVASSLRSNKKVSSLVDKWKAAKEELQEQEEDHRETPLDFLEKKRQREIEVWRAQQVASGDAKENANFQPLGGDWRERVKRRRAQKEAVAQTSSDVVVDVNNQPDMSALSKDLPIGWQAHWDDSSSRVYYSNSLTSETTWTRPTR